MDYEKKVHLATIHDLKKDCFLDGFGIAPLCKEYRATYLTEEYSKVTCSRCLALARLGVPELNEVAEKDMKKRLDHWYEIVWYAWAPEVRNRVLPNGFQPPFLRKKK